METAWASQRAKTHKTSNGGERKLYAPFVAPIEGVGPGGAGLWLGGQRWSNLIFYVGVGHMDPSVVRPFALEGSPKGN